MYSNKFISAMKKAIRAIIQQGSPSYVVTPQDSRHCAYRSEDGKCCVVGHMIDEDNYCSEIEDATARSNCVLLAVGESIGIDMSAVEGDCLVHLQQCHDAHVYQTGEAFTDAFKQSIRDKVEIGKLPFELLESLESQFDMDSLYEMLKQCPHTVDGSFGSSMIDGDESDEEDSFTIEMDGGERYEIAKIVEEFPNSGIVKCKTDEGEIISIQFYQPAPFSAL